MGLITIAPRECDVITFYFLTANSREPRERWDACLATRIHDQGLFEMRIGTPETPRDRLCQLARPHDADVVPDAAVAARIAGRADLVEPPGRRQPRKLRQPRLNDPLVYASSLCARRGRDQYGVPPAARSRSSSPDATQPRIVRRLTPKRRDSSAFDTPRSR